MEHDLASHWQRGAHSALLQDIASWEQSAAEARSTGSFGDRQFIVLTSGNFADLPGSAAIVDAVDQIINRAAARPR